MVYNVKHKISGVAYIVLIKRYLRLQKIKVKGHILTQ